MPKLSFAALFLIVLALPARAQDEAAREAWKDLQAALTVLVSTPATPAEAAAGRARALEKASESGSRLAEAFPGAPEAQSAARAFSAASKAGARALATADKADDGPALETFLGSYSALRAALGARIADLESGGAAQAGGQAEALTRINGEFDEAAKTGDSARAAELADRLFSERSRGDAGVVDAPVTAAVAEGSPSADPAIRFTPVSSPRRGRVGDVPLGDEPAPAVADDPLASARSQRDALLVFERTQRAVGELPTMGRALESSIAVVSAQRAALDAGLASHDWLERRAPTLAEQHAARVAAREAELAGLGLDSGEAAAVARRELAGQDPARLREELRAALTLPAERRAAALAALQGRVEGALGSSAAAAEEEALRRRLEEAGDAEAAARVLEDIQAFGADQADFVAARGGWAALVSANRTLLPFAPEGTEFPLASLGLPGEGSARRASLEGAAGLSFAGPDGAPLFESFDGLVTSQRITGEKGFITVVTDRRGGKLRLVTLDSRGAKLSGETYENLPDGRVSLVQDAAPWPRAIGRMDGRGRFVADEYRNEDGSGRVSVKEVAGGWVLQDKGGKAQGWTWSPEGVAAMTDPDERRERIEAAAKWMAGQARPGEQGEPLQFRNAVAILLEDYLSRRRAGNSSVFMGPDGGLMITEHMPGGRVSQMYAKLEPSVSGRADKGLKVYARSAASADDQQAQFVPLMQYYGNGSLETFSSEIESNTDSWTWWITGPKVTRTPIVRQSTRRLARDGTVSWAPGAEKRLPPETVFESAGIVGESLRAVGTIGKGAVDLGGSVVAVTLAHTPVYYGIVAATGGDAGAAYEDLMSRAKTNFLGNSLARELGGESYEKKLDAWGVDRSVAIQNVGEEMRSRGYDTTGAILQGGVQFANNAVPMLGMVRGMQVVNGLGSTGRIVVGAAGVGFSGAGGWHLGSAMNETYHAAAAYDPSDPAARDRWYRAMTNMTEQSLNAPMLFGAALEARMAPRGGPAPAPRQLPGVLGRMDASVASFVARMPGGRWYLSQVGLPVTVKEEPPLPGGAGAAKGKAGSDRTAGPEEVPVGAEPPAPPTLADGVRARYGKAGEPAAKALETAGRELGGDVELGGSFSGFRARTDRWPKELVVDGVSTPFTADDALMMTKLTPEVAARLPPARRARAEALMRAKANMKDVPSDVDIATTVDDPVRLNALRRKIFEENGVLVEFVDPHGAGSSTPREVIGRAQEKLMKARLEQGDIYGESPEGLDAAARVFARAERAGRRVDSDAQTARDCTIRALADNLSTPGKPVTTEQVFDIIAKHPDMGPGVVARIRAEGLSPSDTLSVYQAVAAARGAGTRVVPAERVLELAAETGKPVSVAVQTGEGGLHQVSVRGTVVENGKTLVTMRSSGPQGVVEIKMPVEDFALILRSGGVVVDPTIPPGGGAAKWTRDFARDLQARSGGSTRGKSGATGDDADFARFVQNETGMSLAEIRAQAPGQVSRLRARYTEVLTERAVADAGKPKTDPRTWEAADDAVRLANEFTSERALAGGSGPPQEGFRLFLQSRGLAPDSAQAKAIVAELASRGTVLNQVKGMTGDIPRALARAIRQGRVVDGEFYRGVDAEELAIWQSTGKMPQRRDGYVFVGRDIRTIDGQYAGPHSPGSVIIKVKGKAVPYDPGARELEALLFEVQSFEVVKTY